MSRQEELEAFLGDSVERLHLAVYQWRDIYYEVITRKQSLKRHNWSQFVKLGKFFARELTQDTLRKYYPQLTNN